MAFCKNCGSQIDEGTRFCAKCGTPTEQSNFTYNAPVYNPAPVRKTDFTGDFDAADTKENKFLALLCYLGIFYLLIALIAKPDSRFIKFHANQALVLSLLSIAAGIVAIVPLIGWIAAAVAGVFSFVCMILGIVNACKGRAKELPLIGALRIIHH